MDSKKELEEQQPIELPFKNLFLNAGYIDGGNKFWMYLMGISFTLFFYLIVGNLLVLPLFNRALEVGISINEITRNVYLLFDAERLQIDKNIILLIQFGLFVSAAIGFWIGIKLIHKKKFISLLTAFEKFRFKHFFFSFTVWSIVLIINMVISLITNPQDMHLQFDLPRFLLLFLLCIVFLPIQTLMEEVFFRSYLLQGLSQVFKNGIVPLIITSLFFAVAHMSNPEISAYGTGLMFAYYLLFAIFLGVITLMSEGLELAFGLHLANNLLSALMVTSKHSVLKTDAIFFVTTEDAASELVLAICALVAVFVLFTIKFKWKDFSLLIK
ncbi:MAG: lysostaphin resistance A-like protein [Bacteroidia bacterium]